MVNGVVIYSFAYFNDTAYTDRNVYYAVWIDCGYDSGFAACCGADGAGDEEAMMFEASDSIKVSIIIPTKNNGNIIARCLDSIRKLDYPEDKIEIVIVDGHSIDNTVEIAKRYTDKIIYEDKGTISYARDLGVKESSGEFIAFTDADCVVDKNWIKNLLKHFNSERIAAVGGPNVTPEDDTDFAKCAGTILSFLCKPGARYGLNADKVLEIYHNPTCNVMYRERVLEEVGGFNHNLVAEDDEELDYRIKEKGYKILFTPDAKVLHYRRPTWKKFMRMAFNYGIGRTQVIKLHRDMGRWYYYTPSMLILVIIILFALSFLNPILPLIAFSILVIGGIGIGLIGLYLGTRTGRMRDFFNFYLLIAIWFWGYGIGMFRGIVK